MSPDLHLSGTTTLPLLHLQDLNVAYPSSRQSVLQNLSLQIAAGSVTAILGPNGAGKTTLLHTILGWLKPLQGVVLVQGKPLSAYTRRELGQIMALVPQAEHISFDYSLLDYTLFGRTPYLDPLETPGEADRAIAQQALEQVGLADIQDRPVTRLSGGERQLLLIARSLAQQPRLILLDEPTSHLDLHNKERVIQLLAHLAGQGTTIVFTSHEPEVAAVLATCVVLMRQGRVLFAGPLEQTLTGPNLSQTYGLPVQVRQIDGQTVILWARSRYNPS